MKVQIKNLLLIFLLLLITATAFSQKVSNVHFEQVGKKIHIYYDLEGDHSFSVKVFCSQDKGENWDGPLNKVSGAVGNEQIKGINKLIVWDVLKEKEKLMGDLSFKVEGYSSKCGLLIVNYAEQVYHTVQIGNQCWMKENLNIGKQVYGSQEMKDNSIIEKYCYNNKETNCSKYGGLYQWKEMMQYSTQEGAQGVCPNGWHIPSDNEWKEMEKELGMSLSEADKMGLHGTNEGGKLKSASDWSSKGDGTNSSGFSALPGGYRTSFVSFATLGSNGFWWSSSETSGTSAWARYLYNDYDQVSRDNNYKADGQSVRCIKN